MPTYRQNRASSPITKISDVAEQPTIGSVTDGLGFDELRVGFTPNARGGNMFRAVSSPGGLVGNGSTSPIVVGGLTPGTSYTFTVSGANGGTASAASASNTPTGAVVPIATATLSSAGGFDFNNIPQIYQDLELVIYAQYAGNGQFGNYMRLNGGTGQLNATSFGRLFVDASSNTVDQYPNQSDFNLGNMPGVDSTNNFAAIRFYFLNYRNTYSFKTILGRSTNDMNGSGFSFLTNGLSRMYSPITRIEFGTSSYVNLSAGSTATLYGVKSAS